MFTWLRAPSLKTPFGKRGPGVIKRGIQVYYCPYPSLWARGDFKHTFSLFEKLLAFSQCSDKIQPLEEGPRPKSKGNDEGGFDNNTHAILSTDSSRLLVRLTGVLSSEVSTEEKEDRWERSAKARQSLSHHRSLHAVGSPGGAAGTLSVSVCVQVGL